jgi:two-component system phosphate regulon sensor histidine kinase PhoR
MTARLFFKLIFAVLIIMVVALTTIDFLASEMAESTYVDGIKREMRQKTEMLSVIAQRDMAAMTPQEVDALARAAGARLTVVAHDGKVLLDSEADPAEMENHGDRPEFKAALAGQVGSSVRWSATLGTNFLYVAAPVPAGAARFAVPLLEVRTQVTHLRQRLVVYTAIAFIPGILLAALFARYLATRLGSIIDYASTLATGNFKARLNTTAKDELGILANQLNETGEKLEKMFEELQREHVELEKLERIRKDFVINVSHELRTPLASIQGYTETLLDGALHDPDNNVRFLHIIRQNAERLGRLTADLLTLSRLELKSQRLQFASYYLEPLLQECIDTLRPVAEKKSIRIEFEPADPKMEVFCDSEAVHQVMTNLLDNAIKYTPDGGRIHVSWRLLPASGRPAFAEIAVADTGIGIPSEDLPRLFERFYRVDKARSRDLGGTGLGLAIVKHLARAHGGEARVESTPGQGSTFFITLPTEDAGLLEPAAVQSEFMVS